MLELLSQFDNILITKYFDRVWRRYGYISNLGETFLNLETLLAYFPEYKTKLDDIIALRFDEVEEEEFDGEDSDDDSEEGEDSSSEEKTDAVKKQDS
jgi:hypothetical protein